MSKPQQSRWWHGLVKRFAMTRQGAWLFSRLAHHADGLTLRLSNNRTLLTSLLTGLPVVWLTTTGAISGKKRTMPLLGIVDGEKVIIIASNFGRQNHPGWYYNLIAKPEAELFFNGKSRVYTAWEAKGEERQIYWRSALNLFPGYAGYQQRATGREIPVMVLAPKAID